MFNAIAATMAILAVVIIILLLFFGIISKLGCVLALAFLAISLSIIGLFKKR